MANVYEWGNRAYNIDANIVGAKLEEIERKKGEVKREDLVEEARPESSELHKLFEWNDEKAANLYRLGQAGTIIHSIRLVIDDKTVCAGYVNIREDTPKKEEGRYINISAAMTSPYTREILLKRALRELNEFSNKYKTLTELADVFSAIDAVQEAVNS